MVDAAFRANAGRTWLPDAAASGSDRRAVREVEMVPGVLGCDAGHVDLSAESHGPR